MPKLELNARIVMICTTSRTPFAPVFLTIRAVPTHGTTCSTRLHEVLWRGKSAAVRHLPVRAENQSNLRIVPSLKSQRKE